MLYMDGDFRIIDDYKCIQGCWFHVHDEKSYLSQSETLAPAVVLLPFSCGGKMSKYLEG